MKINLNKTELEKCENLLNAKEQNISAADFYIEYLTEHFADIKFAKNEHDFYQKMLDVMSASEDQQEIKEINNVCHIDKIEKLNTDIYLKDPYFSVIKDIKAKEGNWQFLNLHYEAYEGFVYNELEIENNYFGEHTPIGYFEKAFNYPAVIENDTIWMSLIPHEIETMKKPIENAHGNVLVLGLGLGYYLYRILGKNEVKSVDVVEIDKRIISLFNKYLINKFPHIEKINVIHADAVEYVGNSKKHYDYVFADIWHNVGDGEMLYLKLKPKEKEWTTTTFDYWIETSILAMLRRQTLTVFSEQLDGMKEEDYLIAKNENDKIINKIYFYHKNTIVDSYGALHDLLTDSSLKEMAKHLF